MVQSIKTDVIYYKLPTDFEFEFNLCGCCQMRLLKSTVYDNSSLLTTLQKCIRRSRVMILVGNVTEDENIITLVSKAIGYNCEQLNTEEFDIKTDKPVYIIENSVPLITDSGIFGGCIIESGPQSMIFLSDDKKVRKEIMNSLVHQYIYDLSRYPVTVINEKINPNEVADETEFLQDEEINFEKSVNTSEDINEISHHEENISAPEITDFEDISTYSTDTAAEKVISEETFSDNDPFKIENLQNLNRFDLSNDSSATPKNNTFYENEEDYSDYDEDDDDFVENYIIRRHKRFNIISLILAIILLLLLIFIVYGFIYSPLKSGITISENFNNIFGFLKQNG